MIMIVQVRREKTKGNPLLGAFGSGGEGGGEGEGDEGEEDFYFPPASTLEIRVERMRRNTMRGPWLA